MSLGPPSSPNVKPPKTLSLHLFTNRSVLYYTQGIDLYRLVIDNRSILCALNTEEDVNISGS